MDYQIGDWKIIHGVLMSGKSRIIVFVSAFMLTIAASIFARLTRGDTHPMPTWSSTLFAATFFAVFVTLITSWLSAMFRQFFPIPKELAPKDAQQQAPAPADVPQLRKRSFGSKPTEPATARMVTSSVQAPKPVNPMADRANIEYLAAAAFEGDFSREAMQKSFQTLHGPDATLEDHIYDRAVVLAQELHKPKKPKSALVSASHDVPILFTRYYESVFKNGLSFFGGRPVGPASMEWPIVEVKGKKVSLQFMMQWDCRELFAADRTGMLPKSGVLYFFCNSDWGTDLSYRFLHQASPDESWAELALPANVGPLHGAEGVHQTPYIAWSGLSASERSDYAEDVPRVLPKWPLKILPFDYPHDPDLDDEDEENAYWNEGKATQEALLELQNRWIPAEPKQLQSEPNIFARPYTAFPQDWAAVRFIAAKIIHNATGGGSDGSLKRNFPDLEKEALVEMCLNWKAEAKAIYDEARQFPLTAKPDQDTRDRIWAWIETTKPLNSYSMNGYILETVRVSMGLMSEGVDDIAQDWIERAGRYKPVASLTLREQYQHEFVRENSGKLSREEAGALYAKRLADQQLPIVRDIFATTPCRMFGPPSYVQGYIEDYMAEHILLLEISSGDIDGLELGEGVLQFVIRPEDLQQGRFDRVEMVCSGY